MTLLLIYGAISISAASNSLFSLCWIKIDARCIVVIG